MENEFPLRLTFTIQAESDSPLTDVRLFYQVRGDAVVVSQPVEFEGGTEVSARYALDTSGETVAPSKPYTYYWKLTDEQGRQVSSPKETFFYDDLVHQWQEISGEDLIVRWYEGDEELGRYVYNCASRALERMQAESGQKLPEPLILLLYARQEDFMAWQAYGSEWAGGLAFPSLGITAQLIPAQFDRRWVENVVPHEIAHMFFYQVVHGPWASWPRWLDEGLAQSYEWRGPEEAIQRAAEAAREGNLIPLSHLATGFGRDSDRVHLAYDESLSVVTYLIETWGKEGVGGLISAFHEGETPEAAVQQALGVSWEAFEAGWITWMGVPTEAAPTATATATFSFPAGPESRPTQMPTATDTPPPTSPPEATPTSTPLAAAAAPAEPTSTPPAAAAPVPATPQPGAASWPAPPLCGARPLSLALAPALLILWHRRRC